MRSERTIKLRVFGGGVVERRVIAIHDDVVEVCTEEEFELAAAEQRDPITVGFRKEYVVSGQGA